MRIVCGVGIYEAGRHAGSCGTKNSFGYKLWHRMLCRCYDVKWLQRRPTYESCSVDSRFIKFQDFMDWAVVQVGYGSPKWALDKDLLVKGNKVYSPEACVFLPPQINQVINLVTGKRTELPVGVFVDKRDGTYYSSLKFGEDNKQTRLGTFYSVESAFRAYKVAKEGKVKMLAEKFRSVIDPRAYAALLRYEVDIGD